MDKTDEIIKNQRAIAGALWVLLEKAANPRVVSFPGLFRARDEMKKLAHDGKIDDEETRKDA